LEGVSDCEELVGVTWSCVWLCEELVGVTYRRRWGWFWWIL